MAGMFKKGSGLPGAKPSQKDMTNMTINQMAGLVGKNQRLGKHKDFLSSIAKENANVGEKKARTGKKALYNQ